MYPVLYKFINIYISELPNLEILISKSNEVITKLNKLLIFMFEYK